MKTTLIVAALALFLVTGTALAYATGLSAALGLWLIGRPDLLTITPHLIFNQLDVFALMAVPLFILTGELMNRGQITRALVEFAMLAAGWLRGGLGHVTVLTAVFFSGISGSAMADAAALSSTLAPTMRERGYPPDYAAALVAAASIIGPIIPPSIIMIFYGAIMGVDIAALFAGGMGPGIALAALLMGANAIYARIAGLPRETPGPLREAGPVVLRAGPSLLLPVLIFCGIVLGWMTPTEAAGVAAACALLLGFYYKALDRRHILESLKITVSLTGAIFIAVAAGSLLGYVAAVAGVPGALAAFVADMQLSPTLYLLVMTLLVFLIGMVIENAVALTLVIPILAPIAVNQGGHPVHIGVLICLGLSLGLLAPPFGGSLLVTSAATRTPYWRLARAALPFLALELVLLLLVALVPGLTLWFPERLGLL